MKPNTRLYTILQVITLIVLLLAIFSSARAQDPKERYHYYWNCWWKYHHLRDTVMEKKYSDSMNIFSKYDARDPKLKTKSYADNKNK